MFDPLFYWFDLDFTTFACVVFECCSVVESRVLILFMIFYRRGFPLFVLVFLMLSLICLIGKEMVETTICWPEKL